MILSEKIEGSLSPFAFVVGLFLAFAEVLVAIDDFLLFFADGSDSNQHLDALSFSLHQITNITCSFLIYILKWL